MGDHSEAPINEGAQEFHGRYALPIHWIMPKGDLFGMEYFGYLEMIGGLLKERLPEGGKVIDFGCGDGRLSAALVGSGYGVTGVDYERQAIGLAKVLVPEAEFMQVDLREPCGSLRAGAADAAVMIEVVEHIHPRFEGALFGNVRTSLKDGGLLIFSVPSVRIPLNRKWHFKHYALDEVRELAERNGFEPLAVLGNHRQDLSWKVYRFMHRFVMNRLWRIVSLEPLADRIYRRRFSRSSLEDAGRFICVARKKGTTIS